MNLLIVGGAGYIGSHMVKKLCDTPNTITILDNLSTGYRDAVLGGEFIQGDIGDRALLDKVFSEHKFDAVLHFASFIQVGESVKKPDSYYQNNLSNKAPRRKQRGILSKPLAFASLRPKGRRIYSERLKALPSDRCRSTM